MGWAPQGIATASLGSVLLVPFYEHSTNPGMETTISVFNSHPTLSTRVHAYFMGSSGVSDFFLDPISLGSLVVFNASDLDPTNRGMMFLAAIDETNGAPVNFNYLGASVRFTRDGGYGVDYPAVAIRCVQDDYVASVVANLSTMSFNNAMFGFLPTYLKFTGLTSDSFIGVSGLHSDFLQTDSGPISSMEAIITNDLGQSTGRFFPVIAPSLSVGSGLFGTLFAAKASFITGRVCNLVLRYKKITGRPYKFLTAMACNKDRSTIQPAHGRHNGTFEPNIYCGVAW